MSIQKRILAFQVIIVLAIIAIAAVAFVDLQTSLYYLNRTQWARQQLAATTQLAVTANRYSEQIAELLLIGEPERPDLESARVEVRRAFAALREATLGEAEFIGDAEERDEEREELVRIDQMGAQFGEIDRAVERVLLLNQQGAVDEAIALFRSEIENRLDAEFERLIAIGLDDEREEVRLIEAELVRLANLLTIATLATAGILLVIVFTSGFLFARSLKRPIEALMDGALAIERGDFDHRISSHGGDEHALLSKRFNSMAEQLGRQRAMLVSTQVGLERQVEERTEQLADANRRLVAIDEERVRLLTDVSHELRTPLTAIRGEAEIALRGASKPEPEYRRALANVVSRAEDLARFVDDLLFLARSEADEIRFHFEPVNLDELMRHVVEEARVLGRERKIRMKLSSAAPGLTVRADPARLQQLILIVLDNAVKYANAGTVVDIVLRGGKLAELSVRDRGKGIAADDLVHVFERFFRGASACDQWGGGTGLGLPIARWIVEKHNGTIELSSTLGEGSEVVMRFPISG